LVPRSQGRELLWGVGRRQRTPKKSVVPEVVAASNGEEAFVSIGINKLGSIWNLHRGNEIDSENDDSEQIVRVIHKDRERKPNTSVKNHSDSKKLVTVLVKEHHVAFVILVRRREAEESAIDDPKKPGPTLHSVETGSGLGRQDRVFRRETKAGQDISLATGDHMEAENLGLGDVRRGARKGGGAIRPWV
jgi:hypothetical protein